MYPISAAAQAQLTKGARVDTIMNILVNSAICPTCTDVPVESGSLKIDLTAQTRRQCDVAIEDATDYLPLVPSGLVSPYGNEFTLRSRLFFDDGTIEEWPIGVFGFENPKIEANAASGNRALSLTGYDRSYSISKRPLSNVYTIASGTNLVTAIENLLLSRRGDLTFNAASTSTTIPAVTFSEGDDAWQKAQDLAASNGMEVFFDVNGVCVIRFIPDPNLTPISWTYQDGDANLLESISDGLTSDGVFSHVYAIGAAVNGAAPVRYDAYDDDSSSPTWYLGPFGDRSDKIQSDLITTTPQAQNAATGRLSQTKGGTQNVSYGSVVNTAQDGQDVIAIDNGTVVVNANFVVQSLDMDLGPGGSASGVCRSRKL